MEKIDIQLIKIFGPSILKVRIPETILNNLNIYIDKIITDKERSKKLDIGDRLVGDVTQEFELEQNDKIPYKQMGNSVNVHNTYQVIYSTLKHYNKI